MMLINVKACPEFTKNIWGNKCPEAMTGSKSAAIAPGFKQMV